MHRREKQTLQIWFFFILIFSALALTVAILIHSIWALLVTSGVIVFDFYWFYTRYYQRRRPRYPLAPPEGKADIYFPRSDIPRPIYADAREMQEKKRKLSKIKKMKLKKK